MFYDPSKFNPFDEATFPTADSIRPYEIDLSRGIFKTADAEDHARAMEALALIKSMPKQPIQAPQPAQWVQVSQLSS